MGAVTEQRRRVSARTAVLSFIHYGNKLNQLVEFDRLSTANKSNKFNDIEKASTILVF